MADGLHGQAAFTQARAMQIEAGTIEALGNAQGLTGAVEQLADAVGVGKGAGEVAGH